MRRRDEEDRERGDPDPERGHEDDVDADAAAVRAARWQCHLPQVAPPVAEDRGALLDLAPLGGQPRLEARPAEGDDGENDEHVERDEGLMRGEEVAVSSVGDPFDTVCGVEIATPISIRTLTAVKKSD